MKDIINQLRIFTKERNWEQFHTPDNLAKSIMIEAAELLENYQWQPDAKDIDNVKDEIADILAYTLMLADYYDFDIRDLLTNKIKKNHKKYPKDKVFGKSDKYTEIKNNK
ncbi:MAG: nucleotide pyrophosphohydrolase [Bacillota bacterium]